MSLLEAIRFHNPTEETFVGMYDGHPYDIPAKATKHFAPHIAEHFAKHLVNKILIERFDNLCQEHATSSKDTIKSCKNCKSRSDKLSNLYGVPERDELLKVILPKEEVKTDFVPVEKEQSDYTPAPSAE